MKLKYIVNEIGNPVEVLIPYQEFRLLEPLFLLLKEDQAEIKNLSPTDLTSFFQERKKVKPIQFPGITKILQEIREDRL